jgi:uncharacterized protein YbaP (TraB family)
MIMTAGNAQRMEADQGYRVFPLCWKVRDRPVYLLASLHSGPPGGFSHGAEVMRAFDAAQTIHFEVTRSDANRVPDLVRRPTGSLLEDLGPELYEAVLKDPRFSRNLESLKLPFVFTEMAAYGFKEIGLTREWGVEKILCARAAANGQKTDGMESAEQFIARLSNLDPEFLRRAFHRVVDKPADARAARELVAIGYLEGNLHALAMARQRMLKDTPQLARCLLTEREALWRPRLRSICDDNLPAMVVIGALHFAGEKNILTSLHADGFKTDPFGS